ncbi:hypothetical protein [Sulfurimonas sp.]|uniref:hypothetical protein n=1 Tax=Sulfurimonas sp. TaxID=2022749 RepID=UPI0026043BC4|nr:hypothetical protein [Sulfurimonas sp.]
MIYKVIMALGLMFILNGCFTIVSSTEIKINKVTKDEYEQIKKDIRDRVTALNPAFDCDSDDRWKANRDNGELICNHGMLYTEMHENNVSVVYATAPAFWIPTKEIITDEHKKMQKLFLKLAKKYKQKYKDSTVEIIFYHTDLPKGGKQLVKYDKNE